ncbi:hypothetical protein CW357_01120 [Rummeliibacillus sp. TYF005]|uniref:hypothetical protein n=1 Tax=Rummeliibacillus sp. TYF005 TaxID=2058214 RepID=UPI000F53E9CA|nr:hypothetical protein [Rummeliibacillus sp. TYF005]RPJ97297.1 hypothetical protein CW357_01120 [Rummeliibacillus sp. TYF005]
MAYTYVGTTGKIDLGNANGNQPLFKFDTYRDDSFFYIVPSLELKPDEATNHAYYSPSGTSNIYCKPAEESVTPTRLDFGAYNKIPTNYYNKNVVLCDYNGNGAFYNVSINFILYYNDTNSPYSSFIAIRNIGTFFSLPTSEFNQAPTISGSDTNVGQKTGPFTYDYTVNDANSTDNLTITEKANGVTIRTIANAVRGQKYTADVSSVWKQMPVNTATTLTITVSDGSLSTTRTITFTRKEDRVIAYFKQASLTPESVQPEQVLVRVIRTIATNADFKVFVCNNGLDASPTWEDATSAVLSGNAYTFTNRMKTSVNYAVNVKIQVLKNTASAYSYIKALGFSYI